MICQTGQLRLRSIRRVYTGSVNDVEICRDLNAVSEVYYTLLVIKSHETAKKLLEIYEASPYSCSAFSQGNFFYVIFDYPKERPLEEFYLEHDFSLRDCEAIALNLITACMASSLPFPLLYLALIRRQIHMAADHSIYFSFQFHLDELEASRAEKDCASACRAFLSALLEKKAPKSLMSYQLMLKKGMRQDYRTFIELYQDARISFMPEHRASVRTMAGEKLRKNQEGIYRVFLAVCFAMGLTTLVMAVSQLMFGDIPLMRLFVNTFKNIGTESLLQ